MPRRLDFDNGEPKGERKPRTLGLPTSAPVPVVQPSAPEEPIRARRPLSIENGKLTHQRRERPRTITDTLVERALDKSPDIDPARVRGRIDMLLSGSSELYIQWGEVNLVPLQQASSIQAGIAGEMQRINAIGWLNETKDSIAGNKGFFDRFKSKKPEFYDFQLNNAKTGLTDLMLKAEQHRKVFLPEVHDLHLDSIALIVVLSEITDPILLNIANSRSKTLMLAHQTGTMLLTVLENTTQQCAQLIEQINSMLSVTIPQWKLSQQT